MILSEKTKRRVGRTISGVAVTFGAFLMSTIVVGANGQIASAYTGTASGGGFNCYAIANIPALDRAIVCPGISTGVSKNVWPEARIDQQKLYKGGEDVYVSVTLLQYYGGHWTVRGTKSYYVSYYLKNMKTGWAGGHDHGAAGLNGLSYDPGYSKRTFVTRVSMKVGSKTVMFRNQSNTGLVQYISSPPQYTNFKP